MTLEVKRQEPRATPIEKIIVKGNRFPDRYIRVEPWYASGYYPNEQIAIVPAGTSSAICFSADELEEFGKACIELAQQRRSER